MAIKEFSKEAKKNIWQWERSVNEAEYGSLFERGKPFPFFDGKRNQTGKMSPSGYKSIIRMADAIKNGSDKCGCGTIGDTLVVEFSGSSPEERQVLVWDEDQVLISSIKDDGSLESYELERGKRDGAVIALAFLCKLIAEDKAAEAALNDIVAAFPSSVADLETLDEAVKGNIKTNIAHLCHKMYKMTADDAVYFDYPTKNVFQEVNMASLEAGIYTPEDVIAGSFKLATAGATSGTTATTAAEEAKTFLKPEEVKGKYNPNPSRVLTLKEQMLVPELDETIIISEQAVEFAKTAYDSANVPKAFKNVLIWGPAGTGKSTIAREIAYMRNRPFVTFSCSADTQIYDFVGQVMPLKSETNEIVKALKAECGDDIKEIDICKKLGIPSMADVLIFPEDCYAKLFKKEPIGLSEAEIIAECYRVIQPKVDEVLSAISCYSEKTEFAFTKTAFIQAIENGWVVEVQEPNVIAAPGVLPGLNSILEEGIYTLATGEVIKRHPEAIVIFTTNATYQGCGQMNQSVIDRADEAYKIATIDMDTMVARAMSASGNTDYGQVKNMAELIDKIGKFMAENGIDDGVCGMRSLIAWASKAALGIDPYKAFETTVLNKCSFDDEFLASIKDIIDNSAFRPVRKGARKRRI